MHDASRTISASSKLIAREITDPSFSTKPCESRRNLLSGRRIDNRYIGWRSAPAYKTPRQDGCRAGAVPLCALSERKIYIIGKKWQMGPPTLSYPGALVWYSFDLLAYRSNLTPINFLIRHISRKARAAIFPLSCNRHSLLNVRLQERRSRLWSAPPHW
jgi:hypothetical protein